MQTEAMTKAKRRHNSSLKHKLYIHNTLVDPLKIFHDIWFFAGKVTRKILSFQSERLTFE